MNILLYVNMYNIIYLYSTHVLSIYNAYATVMTKYKIFKNIFHTLSENYIYLFYTRGYRL